MYRFFALTGMRCGQGVVVRRRLMGVMTGGVPWSIGKHCLYTKGGGYNAIRHDSEYVLWGK